MSEMKEIKKIGVLSAGKIAGILYLALGLLVGIPLACFALFFSSLFATSGLQEAEAAGAFLVSGVGGVVVYGICLPVVYGVMGFIGGAIMALIYNIVAGFMGGLELELGEVGAKY
jgi:hypothetical protein